MCTQTRVPECAREPMEEKCRNCKKEKVGERGREKKGANACDDFEVTCAHTQEGDSGNWKGPFLHARKNVYKRTPERTQTHMHMHTLVHAQLHMHSRLTQVRS